MSLYHFQVTQVSRGKGQTAVASAAYRAGEKLHDRYYGETPDYRKKGGVLFSEILLPGHVPKRLSDRETLWNEVESMEKHPKAQLAYSFNIALQNELSYEENLKLARRFVLENFVSKGMIVDLALHDPDKGSDGIPNPHFRVLSPIRPINPDGSWGNKQRREYLLDENGERIPDENGDFKFNAVTTTDWGSTETLLTWRKNWADLVNQTFAQKGISARIDHRSYEAQGLDLIPTIHEGPTVRAMEAKGIRTDKGDWNRLIRKTNALLKALRQHIKELVDRIEEISSTLHKEAGQKQTAYSQPRSLYAILSDYYDRRNAGAYSNKAKVNNIKQQAKAIEFLQENEICTIEDLRRKVSAMYADVSRACDRVKVCEEESSSIRETLDLLSKYELNRPIYDKLCRIRSKAASDSFKEEHRAELSLFYMARRRLKEQYPDGFPGKEALSARLITLESERHIHLGTYKKLKSETGMAYSIKAAIEADYRKAMGGPEKIHERKSL